MTMLLVRTLRPLIFAAALTLLAIGGSAMLLYTTAPSEPEAQAAGPLAVLSQSDPAVTVSFGHETYLVQEGESVAVIVVLSADPERSLTIPITINNRDNASDDDYSNLPETVTFTDDETRKTITFTATEDTHDDSWEKASLGIGSPLPTGVSAAAPAEAVVSIVDDDPSELVSNMSQSQDTHLRLRPNEGAHGITTGTNPHGYTVTAVQMSFQFFTDGTTEDHFHLLLWPANSDGTAPSQALNAQLGEFVNPASITGGSVGRRTFAAKNDIHLEPETRYYIVMRSTTGRRPSLLATRGDGQTGELGWTIDDHYWRRPVHSSDEWTTGDWAFRIRIIGYSRPDESPLGSPNVEIPDTPENLTAALDENEIVLQWSDPNDDTITGYRILRRDKDLHNLGHFEVHVDDTESATNTYRDRDFSPESEYIYRIKARNSAGLSSRSDYAEIETPPSPAEIAATPAGDKDLGDITNFSNPRFGDFQVNGRDDTMDYFCFTITEPRRVSISLRRQDRNADLYLENAGNHVLGRSEKPGTDSDNVTKTLLEGTYCIRVQAQEDGLNEYRLRYGAENPNQSTVANLRSRQTVSEEPETDLTSEHNGSPKGVVRPGQTATGEISPSGDTDVFRVEGENNRTYRFEVRGRYSGHGTLPDPQLQIGWPDDDENWYDNDATAGGRPNAGAGANESYEFDSGLNGEDWLFRVGGNRGTGTYTTVLTDISNAIFVSPDRIDVPENTTDVVTVVAEDVNDGDTVSEYRIVPDYDHRQFNINSPDGRLRFQNMPDYEKPRDENRDNMYFVEIEAISGNDRRTSYQMIQVTVTDEEEIGQTVREGRRDCAANTETHCSVAADGREVQANIESGQDTDWFSIEVQSGVRYHIHIECGCALENPAIALYDSDGNVATRLRDDYVAFRGTTSLAFTPKSTGTHYFAVSNTNAADTGTYSVALIPDRPPAFNNDDSVEIPENTTVVLELQVEDPDYLDDLTALGIYTRDDGHLFTTFRPEFAEHGDFPFLAFVNAPDFENPADADGDNVYVVTIHARSQHTSQPVEQTIRVTVTDVLNDPLDVEGSDLGDITGMDGPQFPHHRLDAKGQVHRFTFSLTEPKLVELGLRQLERNADLSLKSDSETVLERSSRSGTANEKIEMVLFPGSYIIRVEAKDPGTNEYVLRYGVEDPPAHAIFTNPSELSVQENFVGTLMVVSAIDVDEGHQTTAYEIVHGPDDFWFDITSPGGELSFFFVPDYEQPLDDNKDNVYEVIVKATSGPDNLNSYQTVKVTITDVHDPDDCFNNAQTNCVVMTDGTPKTGEIERTRDIDYFKAELVAGTEYQIDVKGDVSETSEYGGTLADPRVAVYGQNGGNITSEEDNNSGFGKNARLIITPSETGTYLVSVKGPVSGTGAYTLFVADDYPATFSSPDQFTVPENTTAVGTVAAQDYDVNEAVKDYSIVGGADQRRFTITRSTGVIAFLAAPDHDEPSDSDEDNIYEIEVGANSTVAGKTTAQAIRVTVTDDPDDHPDEATSLGDVTDLEEAASKEGQVDGQTDLIDLFSFTQTKSQEIQLSLTDQDFDADLLLVNAHGMVLARSQEDDEDDEAITITLLSGTHYVRVVAQEQGVNKYTLGYNVANPDNDQVDNLQENQSTSEADGEDFVSTYSGSPQGSLVAGSPATGNVAASDDTDAFRVMGHNNRQYRIEVKGSPTSDGTLADPELWVGWPDQPDVWHPMDFRVFGGPNHGVGKNERYAFDSGLWGTDWLFRVGGNGGTGTYTIVLTDESNAIFTSPDDVEVEENTTTVTTVVAEDVDADHEVTSYSIVTDYDYRRFSIDSTGGELSFREAPDYEKPRDSDRDNVYLVEIEAISGPDNLTSYQKIQITVTDAEESG